MILDTRRGRAWYSERRFFQLDRLTRLLLLFSEQWWEPPVVEFPVPVGTGCDNVFVGDVGFGLRVLDEEIPGLVPLFGLVLLLPPPPPDETSVATGPPGKTYGTLGSKIWKPHAGQTMNQWARRSHARWEYRCRGRCRSTLLGS